MAHYAILDSNNVVTQVIVGRDESDLVEGVSDWEAYYGERTGQGCLRTSYNTHGGVHSEGGTPFRFNYAGKGFTFDPEKGSDGAFVPPQPFPSWVLGEDTCLWVAPVPMPEGDYVWDEEAGDWAEVLPIIEVWDEEAGDWVEVADETV